MGFPYSTETVDMFERNVPESVRRRRDTSAVERVKMKLLFTVSTGRVGTMTLSKVLALSPKIQSIHELGPLFPHQWPDGDPLGGDRWDRIQSAKRHGYAVYSETCNQLTRAVNTLKRYPGVRLIYLHRDPRMVVLSGLRIGWYYKGVRFQSVPEPTEFPLDEEAAAEWDTWPQARRCIWRWNAINSFCWSSLAGTDCFELKSSELFHPDLSRLFALFDWLGVDRPPVDALVRTAGNAWNHHPYGGYKGEWSPSDPLPNWDPDWDQWLDRDLMDALGY